MTKQNRFLPLFSLLTAATICIGTMFPALAQEHIPANTITVQGTGVVHAQPDSVQLNLGVETQAKTMEAARNDNARKMTMIIEKLKALGIPNLKIQTGSFSAYPVQEPDPKSPQSPYKIVGYRVNNNINIKVEEADSTQLGTYSSKVLDTALAAGATNAGGPSFYVSQGTQSQQTALKLAVQQAKTNAESIAQAAGVRLSGIYNIEAYAQPIPMSAPMANMRGGVMMEAKQYTPIESGEYDITANVTIRFEFQD